MRAAIEAAKGAEGAASRADSSLVAGYAAYASSQASVAVSANAWGTSDASREMVEYVRAGKAEVAWQGDRLMEFWEEL